MDVGAQQVTITDSLSNGSAPAPTEPAAAESDARVSSQSQASPASDESTTNKPLRRRNKPSLSCETCTVKKTKCDRVRPTCFACVKRRSECQYSHLADLIEESNRTLGIETPRKKSKSNHTASSDPPPVNVRHPRRSLGYLYSEQKLTGMETQNGTHQPERKLSRAGSLPTLLSHIPLSHPSTSHLFKYEHPFSNYWTHQGGLREVISVLPSKDQADILIAKYFDAVDPVYPMIHRGQFQRDYDSFWSLSPVDRPTTDGDLIALIFVMLAMGTQFVALPSPDEKEQTAEFYLSAAHQALRVFSYLGRPSSRSIQAMVLIGYFLMNDNHAADTWAFAGILIRHAYALGLNRDPSLVVPNATPFEKQQRRKLWQAVLLQDTFLTVILKLPPTATHNDVRVEDLQEEVDLAQTDIGITDISYISSMWNLANLVQQTICSPRSLSRPIAHSPAARKKIIEQFTRIYMSFPLPLRTFTESSICELANKSRRPARQTLFLTSNYFHCLMLINLDEHENLEADIHGTLNAAHDAINSFFLLHKLFEEEARVWYHFQHRAFSEAHVIAEVLRNQAHLLPLDPTRMRAKDDVLRMIGILKINSKNDRVAETRVNVLSDYL